MTEIAKKKLTIIICDSDESGEVTGCKNCGLNVQSVYHQHLCPRVGTPPPATSLGSELTSVESVREWLGHPSNQFEGQIFIVKWDGYVPKLSKQHAERLWEGTGLAEVIAYEQVRRKRGLGTKDMFRQETEE